MTVFSSVLDSSTGRPAHGMLVRLERVDNGSWTPLATARTDADGRIRNWQQDYGPALYRLWFDNGGYFAGLGISTIFPEIMIVALVTETRRPTNVVLLVSPFSYSVYREAVEL